MLRDFGTTGIQVSPLGFGAGHIGGNGMTEKEVAYLLNAVLDEGITLIDTARSYGLSEERIGKHISKRRAEFILSTKVGYDVNWQADWSYEAVYKGVEEALIKLQTEFIDIVHLHSCPREVLLQGDVQLALDELVKQGKIRIAAYSGDNDSLREAIVSGRFRSIQTSINICDQKNFKYLLPEAKNRGLGVIAKRPIANACWTYAERPVGNYAEVYWERLKTMALELGEDPSDTALRFTAYTWGVDSCIVGTNKVERIKENMKSIKRGRLPEEVVQYIRGTFNEFGDTWQGEV